jgi:hypothetical protein
MDTQTVFEHLVGVQAKVCKVLGLGRATATAWQEVRLGSAPLASTWRKSARGDSNT